MYEMTTKHWQLYSKLSRYCVKNINVEFNHFKMLHMTYCHHSKDLCLAKPSLHSLLLSCGRNFKVQGLSSEHDAGDIQAEAV